MNNATLEAICTAARYNCSAAQRPPEGFPDILATAIESGTMVAMVIVAAVLAHSLDLDYDGLVESFGIPADRMPPKDVIMARVPAIIEEYKYSKEARH